MNPNHDKYTPANKTAKIHSPGPIGRPLSIHTPLPFYLNMATKRFSSSFSSSPPYKSPIPWANANSSWGVSFSDGDGSVGGGGGGGGGNRGAGGGVWGVEAGAWVGLGEGAERGDAEEAAAGGHGVAGDREHDCLLQGFQVQWSRFLHCFFHQAVSIFFFFSLSLL